MADNEKGLVAAGFSLLWRRQGILWWVFVVNFICGAMGTLPAAMTLNRALHHTFAGQPLTKGFDLGMFNRIASAAGRRPDAFVSHLIRFRLLVFSLHVVRQRRNSRGLPPRPQAQHWRFLCRIGSILLAIRAADAPLAWSLRFPVVDVSEWSTSSRITSATERSPIRSAFSFNSPA